MKTIATVLWVWCFIFSWGGSAWAGALGTPQELQEADFFECGQPIFSNTRYRVSADLFSTGYSACIQMDHVSNVVFDCADMQGVKHSISSVHLNGSDSNTDQLVIAASSQFTVQNCHFQLNSDNLFPIRILNSQNGTLEGNLFEVLRKTALLAINGSSHIRVLYNRFGNSLNQPYNGIGLSTLGSDHLQVSRNRFEGYEVATPLYAIDFQTGHSNEASFNQIEGGFPWTQANQALGQGFGLDDGILIASETNDRIVGNHIANVWDTGIETTGLFSNSLIRENTVIDPFVSGIGAWWGASWLSNHVEGNHIAIRPIHFAGYRANVPEMFKLFRYDVLPLGQIFYWKDNSFIENTFHPQSVGIGSELSFSVAVSFPFNPAVQFVLGNNRFSRNDFGFSVGNCAPKFTSQFETEIVKSDPRVRGEIIDGGGNLCPAGCNSRNGPLRCYQPYRRAQPLEFE